MKRFAALVLALALLCSSAWAIGNEQLAGGQTPGAPQEAPPASGLPTTHYEGPGFDTPEAAVQYYLDGLKALDVEQMLGAFAWETQISRRDLTRDVERMGAYSPVMVPAFPNGSALLADLNVEVLRDSVAGSIRRSFVCYLTDGSGFDSTMVNTVKSFGSAQAVVDCFDLSRLDGLAAMTGVEILTADQAISRGYLDERYRSDYNLENMEKLRVCYGMDEITSLLAIFHAGGKTYLFAPGVARYGDRWYLYSPGGYIAMFLGISIEQQAFGVMP